MKTKFSSEKARQALLACGNPIAAKIVAAAERDWSGDIACALMDAMDGNLGHDACVVSRALPTTFGHLEMTEAEIAEAEASDAAAAQLRAQQETIEATIAAERAAFVAGVEAALADGRVQVLTRREDTGHSYYTVDCGAIARDESGTIFARRRSMEDVGTKAEAFRPSQS